MAALRFPFAAGSGVFMSLSVFWVLSMLVGAPLAIDPAVNPVPVVFTTPRPTVPPVNKRDDRMQRELPPAAPERLTFSTGDPSIDGVTTFDPPPIVPQGLPKRQMVFEADRDAVPFVRIEPDYPPRAIAGNIEGWVKVQFSITATGVVRDAFVVDAAPKGTFDAAALKAVARWRYQPKVEDGVAVERVGVQTIIRFDLE